MLVRPRPDYLWPRYERIAYINVGERYKRDTTTILIITLLRERESQKEGEREVFNIIFLYKLDCSNRIYKYGNTYNTKYSGLYYKSFMIIIYDHNDSGQYYK